MSETPRRVDDLSESQPAPVAETPVDLDAAQEADSGELTEAPTLSELLTNTAQGDQSAFSAFFEATADVVYGLSLIMHAEYDDAHSSTIAVYRHLWDQADARARDLRLQTQASQMLTEEFTDSAQDSATENYRPNEYELVLEWLIPLTHRIFVERFRDGTTSSIPLEPVPQSEGGGVAGLPEEVLEDLLALSDSQAQALALTYLAGTPHQTVADQVATAVPSIKSRLRDAMTRLHRQQQERYTESDPILRAAVTAEDVERSGGVNRNFANQIQADLDKGLLVELAELYALDAIDDDERALLDEKALTAPADQAQEWETRVLAARRTLAEIFASDPVSPPASLLEELLAGLGGQEVGVGLVEDISNHTGEDDRRKPVIKKWMFVAGFLAIVLVGAVVIWQFLIPRDIQSAVDADPEASTIDSYAMSEGGTIDAALSEAENAGYVEFNDVPELEGEDTYQLWLLPTGAGEPTSIGNYTAEELEDNLVGIENLSRHESLVITVEAIRNEERPQGDVVAQLALD